MNNPPDELAEAIRITQAAADSGLLVEIKIANRILEAARKWHEHEKGVNQ